MEMQLSKVYSLVCTLGHPLKSPLSWSTQPKSPSLFPLRTEVTIRRWTWRKWIWLAEDAQPAGTMLFVATSSSSRWRYLPPKTRGLPIFDDCVLHTSGLWSFTTLKSIKSLLRSRRGTGTFESLHNGNRRCDLQTYSQLLWARRMSSSPCPYTPPPAPDT